MKYWSLILCAMPALLWGDRFTMQVRGGFFYPASSEASNIYKKGGSEYETESSVRLYNHLNFWVNFNYFQRHGFSRGRHDPTSIHLYPLSGGLKYAVPVDDDVSVYIGVGPSYTWANIHDEAPDLKRHIHRREWGAVSKLGLTYFFVRHFFLDVYADYYYTRISGVHESGALTHSVDVGGLRAGLGVGASF